MQVTAGQWPVQACVPADVVTNAQTTAKPHTEGGRRLPGSGQVVWGALGLSSTVFLSPKTFSSLLPSASLPLSRPPPAVTKEHSPRGHQH